MLPSTNRFFLKDYFVLYDYIQYNRLKSIESAPCITNLSASIYQIENSETPTSLSDNFAQAKLAVLFYLIFNKIPRLHVVSQRANDHKTDAKLTIIQKISLTKKNEISNLIESFFFKIDYNNVLQAAHVKPDTFSNSTTFSLKCSLSLLPEFADFEQDFNLSSQDIYISINLKFNKLLSKEDILSILNFG